MYEAVRLLSVAILYCMEPHAAISLIESLQTLYAETIRIVSLQWFNVAVYLVID